VVHKEKTYIGMNFDISNRPIKIVLIGEDQLLVLQNDNGQFYPSFGLNNKGTFMNLLLIDPIEEGSYRRGKNYVHIMKLFEEVLSGRLELTQLSGYLEENKIVNVPNHSVHSMIAGPNQETYIVEPGRMNLDLTESNREFMVLTNFRLSDYLDSKYSEVTGPRNDRYIKAYESIVNNKDNFNIATGMNLLMETVQNVGEYPTQLSMLFIPEISEVYFTLNGDFSRVFKFSFLSKEIHTSDGFISSKSMILSKKGILLSELAAW